MRTECVARKRLFTRRLMDARVKPAYDELVRCEAMHFMSSSNIFSPPAQPVHHRSFHVVAATIRCGSDFRFPEPADPDRLYRRDLHQRAALVLGAAAVH